MYFQNLLLEIVKRKRNNTFVMFLVAIKYMEKLLIYELIFDGILVKGLLFVVGCFVGRDLLALMNYRDIGEHILVCIHAPCYLFFINLIVNI